MLELKSVEKYNEYIALKSGVEKKDIQSDTTVNLIDFWASWCEPCKRFALLYDTLFKNYMERVDELGKKHKVVNFAKLEIDDDALKDIAKELSVRSIPTVIAFRSGKEIDRFVGTAELKGKLPKYLTDYYEI